MTDKGAMIVVSAPSGAGKTTLIKRVAPAFPETAFSVSHTTRRPREGERDGEDYHFVSHDRFEEMIRLGEFVEWEEVHGAFYGTALREVERLREAGKTVVFDVDVKGAASIKAAYPEARAVFVAPPSETALRERLTNRGADDPASIERRLAAAKKELAAQPGFDYVVVNDDLERAADEMKSIFETILTENKL
jgi:guanylate kinase